VEALVRWAHPTRGLIPPRAFIPLAEETGLILPIGQMVLRAACEQAVRWQERFSHQGLFSMNVNLSALQLANPAVVDDVARVLAETGLPAACLVLEITETVLVHDEEDTIRRMAQLKGLGVRIAIDDFGTGYSSLSYLRRLPVDILKIDKSFVDGVARDPSDRALAEMIVRLAETLGLQTVAEGIEEPSQLDRLKDLRCQLGQGNLFACPLPAADIETWLSVRPGPALPATPLEPSRASV
jgi:EAL domain-containing protein (putative c-di-GMP-specific phosphodiesterase class I)